MRTKPAEVDESADAEEEKDVYNEQKEKLWQIVLKNRENAMLVLAAASTGRGSRAKQTKINCFFKKKDREKYGYHIASSNLNYILIIVYLIL